MSSERTLVSTFFAAFRLNYAEFAGEMQVLLHSDNNGYSTQKTENGAPLSRRRDSRSTSFTVYSSRRHAKLESLLNPSGAQYLGPIDWPILVRLNCGWVSDTKEP